MHSVQPKPPCLKASSHLDSLQSGPALVPFCVGGSTARVFDSRPSLHRRFCLALQGDRSCSSSGDLSLPCPVVSACSDLSYPGTTASKAVILGSRSGR